MILSLQRFLLFLSFASALFIIHSCNDDDDNTPAFDAAKQALKDDTILVKYLAANNISATRLASGLFYRITDTKPDSVLADTGDIAFIRYEGRLLNDTLFDENINSARALRFEVGLPASSRLIIKGLDEGILQFRKGEKGYLYLPSGLGYGNTAQSKIPASSCLIFYIDLVNLE